MYKYIADAWKKPVESGIQDLMRRRVSNWKKQPAIIRIEKPTRLNKARSLGYKAKQGFIVVRTRVRRGGLRKPRPKSGRRQKRMGVTKFVPSKNMKLIAEERTADRFPNMEVLNSYWVWEDGQHKWFEVILVDSTIESKDAPQLLGRTPRGRSNRGLTSAGKKMRGLRKKS